MRRAFVIVSSVILAVIVVVGIWYPPVFWLLVVLGLLIALGRWDYLQTSQSVRRNFPIIGHMRYLLELIRPEIYQYFIESDTDGMPFDRAQRSLVYQRARMPATRCHLAP